MDLNKVMLIGRLTRDPEIRTTPGGAKVASFGLATGFNWTDQSGQKKEQTEFHNIVLWRGLAGIAEQYLKKGSQVYIEGRLATRSWDDKQSGQKRYRTEVIADQMIMLGRAGGSGTSSSRNDSVTVDQPAPTDSLPEIQIDNSDIPF